MPYLDEAIGTGFIGKRDFGADGSYITTEWLILFIPIIPLRSYRVKLIDTSCEDLSSGTLYKDKFLVYDKRRPSLKQVVFTYLFFAGFFAYLYVLCLFLDRWVAKEFAETLIFPLLACWLLWPWLLRCWGRRKATKL